jgi:hypothetical protein
MDNLFSFFFRKKYFAVLIPFWAKQIEKRQTLIEIDFTILIKNIHFSTLIVQLSGNLLENSIIE